jgi:hypothetical protein
MAYFFAMMDQAIHTGGSNRQLSCISVGMIFLLCLGVMMQMLGVPLTLWNPADAADIVDPLAASILEACSLPSAIAPLQVSCCGLWLSDRQPSLQGLILTSEPFHPPTT